MKNLKTLLLVIVLALGFNTTVKAQSKVAHINIQELISLMPATKKMNAELEKLQKTYLDDITTAQKALEAKYKKYGAEAANQTPEENEKRDLELKQDARKIAASQKAAQADLSKRANQLSEPIYKAADAAVKAVAKAQGVNYVLDASVLLYADGTDLMPLVKKHLGIQ